MTISGQQYPRELVKSRFLKLNMSHVEYVMECLRKNTTKVYNIKTYLLAALFKAGTSIAYINGVKRDEDFKEIRLMN